MTGPPSSPRPAACTIAYEALHAYLLDGSLHQPDIAPPELLTRQGVFVHLCRDGKLRGSMGTVQPLQETAAREIAFNAIQAAVNDPRFDPVTLAELGDLGITVDVLGVPGSAQETKSSLKSGQELGALAIGRRGLAVALPLRASAGPGFPDLAGIALERAGSSGETAMGSGGGAMAFSVRRYGDDPLGFTAEAAG